MRKDYNDDSMKRFDRFNPIMASDMNKVMRPNKKPVLAFAYDWYIEDDNIEYSQDEINAGRALADDLINTYHIFDKAEIFASENNTSRGRYFSDVHNYRHIFNIAVKIICAESEVDG